ncbi:crosslink repair DNA glycosylase YcaQ family protein [Catellatospora sp. KI3]|uniref:winged helix-turn-helix domain-containing protein n=1 Tax=Catellatospora sp. KI3 TaxID=3041620 RepID=UPI0024831875|nr:crosslink repair DNA glycosylase YcaQ family protein [Catellatospora sp. KI3]MDI1460733.1 crosslink repair DNA glycosylase YcaQ family protein [Catellatospora sp. KI3]
MSRSVGLREARRLAVSCQHLAGPVPPPGQGRLWDVLATLRCLQLDPIDVVAHSHRLVLWSRLGAYDEQELANLRWKERRLFDYWAHAASIVLSEDYQLHHAMMRGYPDAGQSVPMARIGDWLRANTGLRDAVVQRLAEAGPLPTDGFDVRADVAWEGGGWSAGRSVERMLDILWNQGVVLVAGRDGKKRRWDLAERCLPDGLDRTPLPEAEIVSRAAEHSLRALGIGRRRDIELHFIRSRYPGLREVVATLVEARRFVPVTLEGAPAGEQWYVHADRLPLLDRIAAGDWSPRTVLLSPFDNLICDRDRTARLWGFDFRTEMYVPAAKREYGYYVLPILDGDQLIGRVAPRLDRRRGVLELEGVYAEPGAPATPAAAARVGQAITALASFVGARRVEHHDRLPAGWREHLGPALDGHG